LLALLGSVAFVLLIACANIANLLMARGSSRGRELAVRAALGAVRSRLIRQLLTESLLLAILGGVGGLVVGAWSVQALLAIAPAGAPPLEEGAVDRSVLLFASGLALTTGLLFGIIPALQASRSDVAQPLKDGMRGGPTAGRRHTTSGDG